MDSVWVDGAAPTGQLAIAEIEPELGGRVGVFALDTNSGRQLSHREDERFAMCSTFKWVLAAATLASIERREAWLDEAIIYGPTDILDYAPITTQHLAERQMTVRDLCRAIITVSDNTAANLLLRKLGGPARFTEFVRSCGDVTTRLDRFEPDLNENVDGDPRDTTTPRAMVELMQSVFCSSALADDSRDLLIEWMIACETGKNRLRAGVPQSWRAGDKTGSGKRGAVNDVAIVYPVGRRPILIAAYMSGSGAESSVVVAAQARIGRLVVEEFS